MSGAPLFENVAQHLSQCDMHFLIRAVVFDGTISIGSARPTSCSPSLPVSAAGTTPISRAVSSARVTFRLWPDVEIPMATSPGLQRASTWRANTVS